MLVHFLPKIFVNFPLIAYLKDLSIQVYFHEGQWFSFLMSQIGLLF